jgi:choline dehydrogenase-like flavoprotein
MGTTRMSSDPKRGVVDSDCRVHGIHNLFISGSSIFPTSGFAAPTVNIVALALRLAEHLKRRMG